LVSVFNKEKARSKRKHSDTNAGLNKIYRKVVYSTFVTYS